MEKQQLVVVATPLERKHTRDNKIFVCRMRELGLTAYGNTPEEAETKVKRMFATWVGLNRESGTLESCLNESKLSWWHENNYDGATPYEVILVEGGVKVVNPKKKPPENMWVEEREGLVVAH